MPLDELRLHEKIVVKSISNSGLSHSNRQMQPLTIYMLLIELNHQLLAVYSIFTNFM
jgi:hypothetical protein